MSLRSILYAAPLAAAILVQPAWSAPSAADEYMSRAGDPADPQRGRQLWQARGQQGRSCTSCHGLDVSQPGRHKRTGKEIAPMAPSVNPERFTDARKLAKWFKRNCKWTLGRECTPQEKADVLGWLTVL